MRQDSIISSANSGARPSRTKPCRTSDFINSFTKNSGHHNINLKIHYNNNLNYFIFRILNMYTSSIIRSNSPRSTTPSIAQCNDENNDINVISQIKSIITKNSTYDNNITPMNNIIGAVLNDAINDKDSIVLTNIKFDFTGFSNKRVKIDFPKNIKLQKCTVTFGNIGFFDGDLSATGVGAVVRANGSNARAYAEADKAKAYASACGAEAYANACGAIAYAEGAGSIAYAEVDGAIACINIGGSDAGRAIAEARCSGAIAKADLNFSTANARVTGAIANCVSSYEATANSYAPGAIANSMAYKSIANAMTPGSIANSMSYKSIANAMTPGSIANAMFPGAIANAEVDGAIANAEVDGAIAIPFRTSIINPSTLITDVANKINKQSIRASNMIDIFSNRISNINDLELVISRRTLGALGDEEMVFILNDKMNQESKNIYYIYHSKDIIDWFKSSGTTKSPVSRKIIETENIVNIKDFNKITSFLNNFKE
jgi:hypothetical protein